MIGDPALPREPSAYPRLITRLYELFRKIDAYFDFLRIPRWDDLRFPAQGINPTGSTAPPDVDNSLHMGTLLFSPSADNIIAGVAQMPHTWQEGTEVRPHIHWTKTTADGGAAEVAWRFIYALSSIGETIGSYSSPQVGTLAVGDLTTLENHNITTFPAIDMTDKKISCMILWRVFRDVSEDTYGSDARLLELDFHYQSDATGSLLEYEKT